MEIKSNDVPIKICGTHNTAICYAPVIEYEAVEQIGRMCNYPLTDGSKIRIMPDVHAGKGCTIGTTMTITDKVVPNIVGVDIGCGMYTVNIGHTEIDFAKVDEAAHVIPSGRNVWDVIKAPFDLRSLHCFKHLRNLDRYLERSLGSLGGGNHFIEIDQSEDGTKYLVIHSGSRNLGKQVAEYYQQIAIELHGKKRWQEEIDTLISNYKKMGKQQELEAAIHELKRKQRAESMPEDLAYLYGHPMDEYMHDVVICQEYAKLNREYIANFIVQFCGFNVVDVFHTIHNYINTDEMILRKGAIAAHQGERVLIPTNMRDGSILAVGKGNPEWNYSAPHGAGRVLSRMKAKEMLSLEEFENEMQGVYTTSVSKDTLDESPMAYKRLDDIIGVIQESVDVIEVLKPIFNFKASD